MFFTNVCSSSALIFDVLSFLYIPVLYSPALAGKARGSKTEHALSYCTIQTGISLARFPRRNKLTNACARMRAPTWARRASLGRGLTAGVARAFALLFPASLHNRQLVGHSHTKHRPTQGRWPPEALQPWSSWLGSKETLLAFTWLPWPLPGLGRFSAD